MKKVAPLKNKPCIHHKYETCLHILVLLLLGLQSACTGLGGPNREILTVTGCMDPQACNYMPEATLENPFALCIYPNQSHLDCDEECLNDADRDGICNEIEIAGCQNETACNYNPEATDEGPCQYTRTFYADVDGDGLGFNYQIEQVALLIGDESIPGTVEACTAPPHYAPNADDSLPECTTNLLDACDVCDGDNSTCEDECGVPNGDNSTCKDECGVPNGDNSTCTGCSADFIHQLSAEEGSKYCFPLDHFEVNPHTVPEGLHQEEKCMTHDCNYQCFSVNAPNRSESNKPEIYNDGIDNDCNPFTRGYYMIYGEAPQHDDVGRPMLDTVPSDSIYQLVPFEGEQGVGFEEFYYGEGFVKGDTPINNKHCPECEYPYHEENTITVLLYHEYDENGGGKMAYISLLAATSQDSPDQGLFQGTIEGANYTMDCDFIHHAENGACELSSEKAEHFRMKWGHVSKRIHTGFAVDFFTRAYGCLTFKIDIASKEHPKPQMKGVQKVRFIQHVPNQTNTGSSGGLTISETELRIDKDGDGYSEGNVFSICTRS